METRQNKGKTTKSGKLDSVFARKVIGFPTVTSHSEISAAKAGGGLQTRSMGWSSVEAGEGTHPPRPSTSSLGRPCPPEASYSHVEDERHKRSERSLKSYRRRSSSSESSSYAYREARPRSRSPTFQGNGRRAYNSAASHAPAGSDSSKRRRNDSRHRTSRRDSVSSIDHQHASIGTGRPNSGNFALPPKPSTVYYERTSESFSSRKRPVSPIGKRRYTPPHSRKEWHSPSLSPVPTRKRTPSPPRRRKISPVTTARRRRSPSPGARPRRHRLRSRSRSLSRSSSRSLSQSRSSSRSRSRSRSPIPSYRYRRSRSPSIKHGRSPSRIPRRRVSPAHTRYRRSPSYSPPRNHSKLNQRRHRSHSKSPFAEHGKAHAESNKTRGIPLSSRSVSRDLSPDRVKNSLPIRLNQTEPPRPTSDHSHARVASSTNSIDKAEAKINTPAVAQVVKVDANSKAKTSVTPVEGARRDYLGNIDHKTSHPSTIFDSKAKPTPKVSIAWPSPKAKDLPSKLTVEINDATPDVFPSLSIPPTSTLDIKDVREPLSMPIPVVLPAKLKSLKAAAGNFRVIYDPVLDPSSVKKGKEVLYRYDGDGVQGAPSDPRRSNNIVTVLPTAKKVRNKFVKELVVVKYTWDKNSTTPAPIPPPSAILITGFPGPTTPVELHNFFKVFGRIEQQENKTDAQTGGNLGICWIRFRDDVPRRPDASRSEKQKYEKEKLKGLAQDGHAIANLAVLKGHGRKIGSRMMMESQVVKVVLDGEGKLCRAAVAAEMDRRHPPKAIAPVSKHVRVPTPSMTDSIPPPPPLPAPSSPPPPPPPLLAGPRKYPESISRTARDRLPQHRGAERFNTSKYTSSSSDRPSKADGTAASISPQSSYSKSRLYPTSGEGHSMSSAIAVAVGAAKKRLEYKQKRRNGGAGEADMVLTSDKEAGRSDTSSSESEEERAEDKVFFHRDVTSSRRTALSHGTTTSSTIIPLATYRLLQEKLADNSKAYIMITKMSFYAGRKSDLRAPVPVLDESKLEKHFRSFGIDRTFADSAGWYVTFEDEDGARKAFEKLHRKPFDGVALNLDLRPPMKKDPAKQDLNPLGLRDQKTEWTDLELVEEASELVIKELVDTFKSDVKHRLISGKVWEHMTKWEEAGSRTVEDVNGVFLKPHDTLPGVAPLIKLENQQISLKDSLGLGTKTLTSLPSFARRKPAKVPSPSPEVIVKAAMSNGHSRVSSEAISETGGAEAIAKDEERSIDSSRTEMQKRRTAKIYESESDSEDDEPLKVQVKKQLKKRAHVEYTSSEGEDNFSFSTPKSLEQTTESPAIPPELSAAVIDADNGHPALLPIPKEVDPIPKKKRGRKPKPKPAESKHIAETGGDDLEIQDTNVALPTPAPTDTTTSTMKRALSHMESDDDNLLNKTSGMEVKARAQGKGRKDGPRVRQPTPDPFETGLAADEEDLFYLKLAIGRPRMGLNLHPTPPPSDDENELPPPRHPSGCARTEGYYPITIAEKMANRPLSNKAKAAFDGAGGVSSGVAVSRLARANTRGLVRGMELNKRIAATDTDVLKFNQLRTRKKQLTFSRSGIEGYGLFALEHIPAGEMVIEYVGELIRQQVADRREKAYERQGIGSSYLFRVDEDLVVDATKKGNLGRLINHCCAPNCTARIITINGEKKIVIYAKTNIEPGDEVTYDYHFPHEEVKIPCLCAHPLCRKYLN